MKKSNLETFIKKYYLSGTNEAVKWKAIDNKLSVDVSTDNKLLHLNVTYSEFSDFKEVEFGIHDTSKFLKLINILQEDVNTSFEKNTIDGEERITGINLRDKSTKIKYVTADLTVIPEPATLKKGAIPEFEAEIIVDKEFISKFSSAKSALPDATAVTFWNNDDQIEMVFGHNIKGLNSTNVKFQVETIEGKNSLSKMVHFNADLFKEILSANKDVDKTTFNISNHKNGLGQIIFTKDNICSTYYLVGISEF